VILKPHDRETADVLKDLKGKGLHLEEQPLWPRVIISGVPSDLDANKVISCIVTQNPELGLSLDTVGSALVAKFKKGIRDRDTVTWVCEIHPELFPKLKEATVFIEFMC